MQIFPRTLNLLPLVVAGAVGLGGAVVTFGVWYYFSPWNLQVGYEPTQPVPYSHRLHVGQLGLDCRYCHVGVERSARATIPSTQTCMGCHAVIRKESPLLEPVRASWRTGESVPWVRVHALPDHAFFDHSVHVTAGVGCASCHGRVDQMDVVRQEAPLSMGWCLECHRDPGGVLRPADRITDMACGVAGAECSQPDACCSGTCADGQCQPLELARAVREVNPPEHCSGCHR